jgi:hypothetical protein
MGRTEARARGAGAALDFAASGGRGFGIGTCPAAPIAAVAMTPASTSKAIFGKAASL